MRPFFVSRLLALEDRLPILGTRDRHDDDARKAGSMSGDNQSENALIQIVAVEGGKRFVALSQQWLLHRVDAENAMVGARAMRSACSGDRGRVHTLLGHSERICEAASLNEVIA
jgi:hypothetical protein